jgi:hypothetical protein
VGRATGRGANERSEERGRPDGVDLRWFTIAEIATMLKVSVHTVRKWSARGAPWFPEFRRLPNRQIRVREDWLRAWLDQLSSN